MSRNQMKEVVMKKSYQVIVALFVLVSLGSMTVAHSATAARSGRCTCYF